MRMSHATMYARVLESDASCDGRFFTGVLTTGIYCLPSCRARKPKPGNVKFFPSCEAARAAGLRPCRKCHPDDFARGADPVQEDMERLVEEIRAAPTAFPDTPAVVRRSGFGPTRLFELFRRHYQSSPADLLVQARIEAARRRLLSSTDGLLMIATEVGFESQSVFHDHFKRLNGLTPASYRALPASNSFTIALPEDFEVAYFHRALTRDTESVTERFAGNQYTMAVRLAGGAAKLTMKINDRVVEVKVKPVASPEANVTHPSSSRSSTVEAHHLVVGMLGLDQDTAGFNRLVRSLGLGRLTQGRPGLRLHQTPTVFDGMLWAIIGQQVNFPFACRLKRRLIERTGSRLDDGLHVPPSPAAIAALEPADLAPLQFSRQKAEYLVALARRIVRGEIEPETLRAMSATRVERTLRSVHGLGPWSVNYIMMRSLGYRDCVPLGDTEVTGGLQAALDLEERPDADATRRLMSVFSPYRSLATAHLWQYRKPLPS